MAKKRGARVLLGGVRPVSQSGKADLERAAPASAAARSEYKDASRHSQAPASCRRAWFGDPRAKVPAVSPRVQYGLVVTVALYRICSVSGSPGHVGQ